VAATFNRPGGNVTGVSLLVNELAQKRLELLHELVPTATSIGLLSNPTSPTSQSETNDVQAAARVLGLRLHVKNASSEREIDTAYASSVQQRVNALFIAADAFFTARRDQLVALAARHALPASYGQRDNAAAGGLMSYSASVIDAIHRAILEHVVDGAKDGGGDGHDRPFGAAPGFDTVELSLQVAVFLFCRCQTHCSRAALSQGAPLRSMKSASSSAPAGM
jgi:ABC-type uncharacterized transport system substrate-binding protein